MKAYLKASMLFMYPLDGELVTCFDKQNTMYIAKFDLKGMFFYNFQNNQWTRLTQSVFKIKDGITEIAEESIITHYLAEFDLKAFEKVKDYYYNRGYSMDSAIMDFIKKERNVTARKDEQF